MFQMLLILRRTHYFSSKDKKNSLNVLFSNVDTLSNICSELEATLSIENAHVIGLCEIYTKTVLINQWHLSWTCMIMKNIYQIN